MEIVFQIRFSYINFQIVFPNRFSKSFFLGKFQGRFSKSFLPRKMGIVFAGEISKSFFSTDTTKNGLICADVEVNNPRLDAFCQSCDNL